MYIQHVCMHVGHAESFSSKIQWLYIEVNMFLIVGCFIQVVHKETSDWLMVQVLLMAVWRYVLVTHGALSVMMAGVLKMLEWSAGN